MCTGNTCRSPMAAALFERLAGDEPGLAGVELHVVSAGLQARAGQPAAEKAVQVGRDFGLDLSGHASRVFDEQLAAAELILTMTESQKSEIIVRFPHAAANVYTLKEYAGGRGDHDIADPFGGDDEAYKRAFLEIRQAVMRALKRLKQELETE